MIMVSEAAADTLPMTCRGGERCCGQEETRLCDEGEGDCDNDNQVNTGHVTSILISDWSVRGSTRVWRGQLLDQVRGSLGSE